MRNIKLRDLLIKNFKGISEQVIGFYPHCMTISGRNASGKTTLVDAFMWLLFGKDSAGRTDFQVRPVDEQGQTIDNTEIKVEATLVDDSDLYTEPVEVILTKVQKQKWVKKRGADAPTFSGNENTYLINGVPVSQKEFEAKVASLVDEKLFRMLTNPVAFAQLPWKDQREILLLLVPEITDSDILAAYPMEFISIKEDILSAGVDGAKEKANYSLKKYKQDQKAYPVRIDEALKQIVVVDVDALSAEKAEQEERLTQIREQKSSLEAQLKSVSEVQSEIISTKLHMTELEGQEREKTMQSQYASMKAYEDAKQEVRTLTDQYNRTADALKVAISTHEANQRELHRLRGEYEATKARQLPEGDTICPVCGREFEAEKVEEIRNSFTDRKRTDMASIRRAGDELNKSDQTVVAGIERMTAECEKLKAEIIEKSEQRDALKTVYETAPRTFDMATSVEYAEAQKRLDELKAKLSTMADGKAQKQALDEAERGILEAIKGIDAKLAVVESNQRAEARVEELREAQLDCSQSVAAQERLLCLLEEFMKRKMDVLSESINSKFKYVRFKLFETLINGAINPTCVMQIASNGSFVDYKDANHAAQIIGGLDVIHALSGLYGVTAPVWIDNAEALDSSNTPESDSQLILLKVTDDPVLTFSEGR